MLSNLPGRLASPFALFGDDAKLAFRTQPGGILKLSQTRNIKDTDSYWDQYLVLFDSVSDVFSLISPHDIRRALVDAPENVGTLVQVVSSRLFNLVSDHTFPSSTNASVTSIAQSLIKSTSGNVERNTTKEVLNCIRVLQRVMPVVFESETEMNAFEQEVLWKKVEAPEQDESTAGRSEEPQFVIDDEEGNEDEQGEPRSSNGSKSPTPSTTKQKTMLPSLAERLFSCTMDLLFCCGFTIPKKIQVDHYKINYVIWEKGVGSTVDPGPSHPYDSNKTEVLRLLLILLSRQIYIPPTAFFARPTSYTLHLIQKMPRRDVLTLLCSLMNTALQPPGDSGTTVGAVTGKLPYNHLVFKGENPRASLVGMCFQLLCVILDYQSGKARDKEVVNGDSVTCSPTANTNAFRYFLAKLHRPSDFEFILNGISAIMGAEMSTFNNLLPGSRKSIPHVMETFIFFWKMIELNKKFRLYVLSSDKAIDLLAYILGYALEIKDKPQQQGISRALSYIVQTLSAEPAFGQQLSSPMTNGFAAKWTNGGNAGDFMIFSIYSLVATTSGSHTSLYPALIIALSNCAPCFKNLSVTSSQRLMAMFKSFSNPAFLLSDEGHPRLLYFMLEAFNGIIMHNLASNPNLTYALLREHVAFEDLGTFTLVKGLREVHRIQLAKDELARKAAQNPKGKNRDADEGSPRQEKARLLQGEDGLGLSDSVEQITLDESKPISGAALVGVESPPMSPPAAEAALTEADTHPKSEKARGKMKAESRSTSMDSIRSYDRVAAGIGRNGFIPTQEWVASWQQGLPLDIVMLMISELLPRLREVQGSVNRSANNAAVMKLLGSASLQHVLPPVQPAIPRRFIWSDASIVWLTSLIWGEVYVRSLVPLGIWNGTNVRLFYVKHTQVQSRQITDAVSTVVGGLWGRGSGDDNTTQAGRPRTPR